VRCRAARSYRPLTQKPDRAARRTRRGARSGACVNQAAAASFNKVFVLDSATQCASPAILSNRRRRAAGSAHQGTGASAPSSPPAHGDQTLAHAPSVKPGARRSRRADDVICARPARRSSRGWQGRARLSGAVITDLVSGPSTSSFLRSTGAPLVARWPPRSGASGPLPYRAKAPRSRRQSRRDACLLPWPKDLGTTLRGTVRIPTRLNLRTQEKVISPSPWWHLSIPKRLTRSVLSPRSPPDFEV